MSNVATTIISPASAATTATVYNITIISANTEFSQAFSSKTKSFTMKNRDRGILKFTLVSGESGTKFITIGNGGTYTSPDNLNLNGKTIFFQSDKSSVVVEIIEWS